MIRVHSRFNLVIEILLISSQIAEHLGITTADLFQSRNRDTSDFNKRWRNMKTSSHCFNLVIEILLISRIVPTTNCVSQCSFQSRNRDTSDFKFHEDVRYNFYLICFNLVIEILLISSPSCSSGLRSMFLRFNLVIEILLISIESKASRYSFQSSFQSRNRDTSDFKMGMNLISKVSHPFQSRNRDTSDFK